MTAYTGIQGQNILIVSSDPANPTEGQIWYNSTSNLLKGYANVVTNSWASGGNLNTARSSMGTAGISTATLAFGGDTASLSFTGATEKYNGTAWTSNPTGMSLVRYKLVGGGTQTAALAASGDVYPTYPGSRYSNATESFNGSSWTGSPVMTTGRYSAEGGGTPTAFLVVSGYNGSYITTTELYNGTWTTSPANLTTARGGGGSAVASSTAALVFGGYTGTAYSAATESFNGTSWAAVSSMNTARASMAGCGVQTLALAFGGDIGPGAGLTATELWNGTSWSTNPTSLSYARYGLGGAGTQTSGLAMGGIRDSASPQYRNNVEEWTGTQLSTRTITTS